MIITLFFLLKIVHFNPHSSSLMWLMFWSLILYGFILYFTVCIIQFWLVSLSIFVLFYVNSFCGCIVYPLSCMLNQLLQIHKVKWLICSFKKEYIPDGNQLWNLNLAAVNRTTMLSAAVCSLTPLGADWFVKRVSWSHIQVNT